jgi:CubicO group peptidase (beta-lactamase class C family)
MASRALSAPALRQLRDAMMAHVERGAMPGLAYLVARGGDVHVEVLGTMAFHHSEPMPRDAIFRIASLGKPITAAAVMTLVDDGTLRLDDPVDNLLPELADRRVLRSLDSPLDDTVPADRAITVADLLTCRLGLGVVMAPPDTYPIQAAEADRALRTFGPPWPPSPHSADEWMALLGELPLIHQPGEGWMYNTGITVAGILLERAAGKPVTDVLRERLFDPLGMLDSGLSITSSQRHRFTTAYTPDPQSGELSVLDDVDGFWSEPPALGDLAGWLVSTLDDYWAFVQMMIDAGHYDGNQVLSPGSVEAMTTNQITEEQRASATMFLGPDAGWGLGMAAPVPGHSPVSLPRGYGWNGGSGTSWYTDPDTGLTGILLTQRGMTSPEPPAAFVDFWEGANQALA